MQNMEDMLYDIKSLDLISTRMHEIYSSIDIILDTIKPVTKLTKNTIENLNIIKTKCERLESNWTKSFSSKGIHDENMEQVEENIIRNLKLKLCKELRQIMVLNEDAYNNIETYVDEYFQMYDIENRVDDRAQLIKEWIEMMQNKK